MRHSKTGGVLKYQQGGRTYYQVSIRYKDYHGEVRRYREAGFPTREMAERAKAKKLAEALDPPRAKPTSLTVREAWEAYKPISERDNDSYSSDCGRAAHLLQHLGDLQVTTLGLAIIDRYRATRTVEPTKLRKMPPSPQQLDHEVGLLKRILNYAVACDRLESSPVAKVKLLRVPNTRERLLNQEDFEKLLAAAEAPYKPILAIAHDLGLRRREILDLTWAQTDLAGGFLVLEASDTKTEKARRVYMTSRVLTLLQALPRGHTDQPVFPNPETGRPWSDIKKTWARALKGAGLSGYWFHDLRRAALTNARRQGVPETVVMRMSGHRTRSAFERYNIIEDRDLEAAARAIDAGQARTAEAVNRSA